ncbi:hypothetical protein F2P81_015075 [Scophthalmus maximus]|uniref:Uncharacterized protein n=1 Tax=Scophthalmus maximus TaxID=52904 RepID=A0A6A4SJT3_SCOMX|nr:hypothetical protein F2P81_015075 [Scophthalmus maximus]
MLHQVRVHVRPVRVLQMCRGTNVPIQRVSLTSPLLCHGRSGPVVPHAASNGNVGDIELPTDRQISDLGRDVLHEKHLKI